MVDLITRHGPCPHFPFLAVKSEYFISEIVRVNFHRRSSALILGRSFSYFFAFYAEIKKNTVSSSRVFKPRPISGVRETCCSLSLEGTSYSLPPEETCCSLPPKRASYSLLPEETCCSLPHEGTSCSLPFEKTRCFLPFEETSYSLVIASGPEVAFFTPAIPVDHKVPTSFNQNYVDNLKAHIVKLYDIPEGVLVRSGLSRVWRNPMCDLILRRPDNTVLSIHDFLCMPSLDKVTVLEEPHGLDTFILGRVVDRTSSPVPAGQRYPPMQPRKPNRARKGLKRVLVGSQLELGTSRLMMVPLDDDDDQHDDTEFAMEGIESLNDVDQGVSEDASPSTQEAVPASDTKPLNADAGADEIASDGNVDLYYDVRVSNIVGDVLERDLLPFVPGSYYIPYPYDEGSGSESPPYTKDDQEEIHEVNLGLRKKELYKDLKVCRTALDRFLTLAETHRLRELSSVKLSDRMSVLQCQLITHGSMLNSRYDHSLRNVERLSKHWDKKHRKYRNERDTLTMEKEKIKEELIGTKSQLEHRKRQAEEIQGSIASFFQSDFTPLVRRFLKSGEFNRAFAGVLNTAINVGVERGLRMGRTDEEFRGLSQRVVGFIPDAKEKFDKVVAAFPDTTFPFLDKTSSTTTSLSANTHVRHFTSSSGTFGHTSTPKHLKKTKKCVKKEAFQLFKPALDCSYFYFVIDIWSILPEQLLGYSPRVRA
uniref:Transposase (Putative), gypsy type n=1 Tax=Tanacetum cinerariifolium TaxID=118510 RepID=A0A699GHR3_TANCI|nr:hypothetical protein [Tanacetum cinerariifolium]